MLFINTRPEDRAHSLNQALIQEGIQVESLPLLELVAEPFTVDLMQLYDQLKASQVIVVVSPTAVEIGMLYLKNSGIDLDQLKHIQWIAVGQATAAALKTFGIDSLVPDVESSEGMLQLPILRERVDLNTVAFWRGHGGRQFMMQHLQQTGVKILNFILYRRQCPELSLTKFPKLVSQLVSQQPVFVLISSEASWRNWQRLTAQISKELDCIYLVLGERLAQVLCQTQNQVDSMLKYIQLETLAPLEIIHSIQGWQGQS